MNDKKLEPALRNRTWDTHEVTVCFERRHALKPALELALTNTWGDQLKISHYQFVAGSMVLYGYKPSGGAGDHCHVLPCAVNAAQLTPVVEAWLDEQGSPGYAPEDCDGGAETGWIVTTHIGPMCNDIPFGSPKPCQIAAVAAVSLCWIYYHK